MWEKEYSYAIEPGLSLILSDFDTYSPHQTSRNCKNFITLSLVLEGLKQLNTPTGICGTSDNMICICLGPAQKICPVITACTRYRCVDLQMTHDWFENSATGRDPAFQALRRMMARSSNACEMARPGYLDEALKEVIECRNETNAISRLRRNALAMEMLCEAAKLNEVRNKPRHITVQKNALECVHSQILHSPESISSIAGLACENGFSLSKLKRDYKTKYNISIGAAVKKARLEMARRFIEQGDNIAVAGYRAGYQHPSSFSSAFRNHFGFSPRQIQPSDGKDTGADMRVG